MPSVSKLEFIDVTSNPNVSDHSKPFGLSVPIIPFCPALACPVFV